MSVDPSTTANTPEALHTLAQGVRAADPSALGRAITLVESQLPAHYARAQRLIELLLPSTGKALRIGITGVPGVGKSSLIEALGTQLTAQGKRIAVLAIDPSSSFSGGSILGDKTRMPRLSVDPKAFIRPSPNRGSLGGIATQTREAALICEAAGFDIILIETVGTGQSETLVAEMVDCFVLLLLANAGDDLQGIKRGIVEMADILVITKADGSTTNAAQRAQQHYRSALQLLRAPHPPWIPQVLCTSALEHTGLRELWQAIEQQHQRLSTSGALQAIRQQQQQRWMWSLVRERLFADLSSQPAVQNQAAQHSRLLRQGKCSAQRAANAILNTYKGLKQ